MLILSLYGCIEYTPLRFALGISTSDFRLIIMKFPKIRFIPYDERNFGGCLSLFDGNCPQYFAINERQDYSDFLQSNPLGYVLGFSGETLVSAFGLNVGSSGSKASLSWILVSATAQGNGLGNNMMDHLIELAVQQGVSILEIAASNLSAPFFAKFGATTISETAHGWGLDMHRVDMRLVLS